MPVPIHKDFEFSSEKEFENHRKCVESLQLGDQIEVQLIRKYDGWRFDYDPGVAHEGCDIQRIFCPIIGLLDPRIVYGGGPCKWQVAALTSAQFNLYGNPYFDDLRKASFWVDGCRSTVPDFDSYQHVFSTSHFLPRIYRILKRSSC